MELLGSDIDIAGTKYVVFKKHWVLVIILVASAVADAMSTTYFMRITGPGEEMNLGVRLLSGWCGIVVGPVIGKLWQVLAMYAVSVITPRLTRVVFITVIAVNLYAAFFNFQT